MERIKFVSAGAGSGKTYTLVKEIVSLIKGKRCHADQIILTTFTVAAAEELREKVRQALYEEKLFEEAMRLDNAAIGTIHSIAYEMVRRYWYLLNISADVRLLADDAVNFYKSQSLAALPDRSERETLREIRKNFDITRKDAFNRQVPDIKFWQKGLSSLIDKIESFGMTNEDLERSRVASWELISDILDLNEVEPKALPSRETVKEWLEEVIESCSSLKKGKPEEKQKKIEELLSSFMKDTAACPGCIKAYVSLGGGMEKAMTKELHGLCPDQLDRLVGLKDEALRSDVAARNLKEYIDIIFSLASRWMKEYEKFKNARRLLDFNDTQRFFGILLEKKEVVNEMKSRFKVALVDEFQDCSPQQVKFFGKLSELMERSVWVGDIKQAIYGFRGTDTTLVKEVMDHIARKADGNDIESLRHCWRSNEAITGLVNSVFETAFLDLSPDMVKLSVPGADEKYDRPEERIPIHIHTNISRAAERYDSIAEGILRIREEEGLGYKDMAVLCHGNKEAADMAAALVKAGVPVKKVYDEDDSEENNIVSLLHSIVSVAANERNDLSKALVAYYTEPGQTASRILSDRLKALATDRDNLHEGGELDEVTEVKRINTLRLTVGNQSLAHAVETLLLEIDAEGMISRVDPDVDGYKVVCGFCDKAADYEQLCDAIGLPCTLPGFLAWIERVGIADSGNEDGITVTTYHRSKGLEWKCVTLLSLSHNPTEMSKVFFDVKVLKDGKVPTVYMVPLFIAGICSGKIKRRIEDHSVYGRLKLAALEEAKRLLYVGMTRPKELLVTVTSKAPRAKYATEWVDMVSDVPMDFYDRQGEVLQWYGHSFRHLVIDWERRPEEDGSGRDNLKVKVVRPGDKTESYAPAAIAPSSAPSLERLVGVEKAGEFAGRLYAGVINGDDEILGTCIHKLLCSYRDTPGFIRTVKDMAVGYGVTLRHEEFVDQARKMYAWLRSVYGEPIGVEREIPFSYKLSDGQMVNGEIDLLYRTAEGDVLVDYKTCLRPVGDVFDPSSKFYAGKYSGQLALYEDAVRLAGRRLRDSVIIYFNLGIAVRMKF